MKLFTYKSAIVLGLSLGLIACEKHEPIDSNANSNYFLTDNQSELAKRITIKDEPVQLQDVLKSSSIEAQKQFSIQLIAEVAPPQYLGQTLQASHVKIMGSYAIVTYNTQGDKHLGGVEVYDISDVKNPVIKWQAIFPYSDVSAVDYFDNRMAIVGATSPSAPGYALKSPAFLQLFSMNEFNLAKSDTIIDIPSYAGTGVSICPDAITAVGGSNGGLSVFDHALNQLDYFHIKDARAVAIRCSDIFVLQAQPATIKHFTMYGQTALFNSIAIGSDLQSEAKSGVEATSKYIFTALNFKGVEIYKYDGTLKQRIDAPIVPEGRNAENYVSNTVTVNDKLVMIANGEGGVYVGKIDSDHDDNVIKLGSIKFNDGESVNYIESKDDLIVAATGKGGLKIMTVKCN